jgi:hypothetical protein
VTMTLFEYRVLKIICVVMIFIRIQHHKVTIHLIEANIFPLDFLEGVSWVMIFLFVASCGFQ